MKFLEFFFEFFLHDEIKNLGEYLQNMTSDKLKSFKNNNYLLELVQTRYSGTVYSLQHGPLPASTVVEQTKHSTSFLWPNL